MIKYILSQTIFHIANPIKRTNNDSVFVQPLAKKIATDYCLFVIDMKTK